VGRLPLFPLGTVLFPGLVIPLHVFEQRYQALVRDLDNLPDGVAREFGVVAIRAGLEVRAGDAPDEIILHEVGCTAEVRQLTERSDGRFDLVAVGHRRFRIVTVDRSAPYLRAEIEWLPEASGPDEAADQLAPRVLARFRRYLSLLSPGPDELAEQLPDDPSVLSHLVAATMALTLADRQSLLAAPDAATRLRHELRLLSREAALLRQVRAVPVPLTEFAEPPGPN